MMPWAEGAVYLSITNKLDIQPVVAAGKLE
jgi:hypothetical protein